MRRRRNVYKILNYLFAVPAGLERDVQELYDYVNELINTAESKGNECIDKDACLTILNRLTSRVQKMMNKVLALEK